jgi:hypothetical protein
MLRAGLERAASNRATEYNQNAQPTAPNQILPVEASAGGGCLNGPGGGDRVRTAGDGTSVTELPESIQDVEASFAELPEITHADRQACSRYGSHPVPREDLREHKDSGTEVPQGQHEATGATASVREDHTTNKYRKSTTISIAALCFNIVVLAFYFGMHCTPMVDVSFAESVERVRKSA